MLRVRSIFLAIQKRPQERLQGRSASPCRGGITHGQFDQISAFFAVSERVFVQDLQFEISAVLFAFFRFAFRGFKILISVPLRINITNSPHSKIKPSMSDFA